MQLFGNASIPASQQNRLFWIQVPSIAKPFVGIAGNEFPHAGVPGRCVTVCFIRALGDIPAPQYLLQKTCSLQGLAMHARE